MAETVIKLAYEEAVRTIKAQEAVLDNLRSRAGTLVAVASLVTSFLGGQALAKPTLSDDAVIPQEIGIWAVVAIALFVAVAGLALAILWPWKWKFDMRASVIVGWPQGDGDYEGALRDLALYHDENHQGNKRILEGLFWCFRVACVLLVAETVAWIFDIGEFDL